MPGSLFIKEEEASNSPTSTSYTSAVSLSSLNRDGSRSAFSPYKPTTVLTNLQRGNVQTQTLSVLPERGIHQLAAQGELFIQNTDDKFDVDQADQNGFTPLMWAAGYGQLDTVRKLIAMGASILSVGSHGENSLILASSSGHALIVKELINHGSELNYKDNDGNTALMYACYNNHGGCVQELLNAGADLTLINESLESAFDIAIKRRSKHAQAIIEKHMLNLLHSDSDNHE
uniref:Ankyrin repeat family A protein 2 n=1 Tax=Parasteatoda tepidariorum TaxID=114398 RepID=A0A2L2YFP9_PARTP